MKDTNCPTCQDPGLLLWYAAGTLSDTERELVEERLGACAECRQAASDNERLGRAVRSGAPNERSAAELVTLAGGSREDIERAGLSVADEALVSILRKVDGAAGADTSRGWGVWFRRGWDFFAGGGGALVWLRSPAAAYLLLLVMAYPAYLGVTSSGPGSEPEVLATPRGLDTGTRSLDAAEVSFGEDDTTVLTVFVPMDERYAYRLDIRSAGRPVFRQENVQSFDGVGTIGVLLRRGFLSEGAYEVVIVELDTDSTEIQTFRFPFRVR